ncbi:MAG: cell wall hydrolase [Pseudomonadota bacterium]
MEVSAHRPADQHCLALAMYWEARGEINRGMAAVGAVVLNRVADSRFPDSVCTVVKQGGETPPCQFSWWCDGKSDRPRHAKSWQRALSIADDLLHNRHYDTVRGALFFHSASIRPKWRYKRVARIGQHVFYR